MGVRKRKQREKGERLAALGATAPTNPDPVVMLIVRLLAPSTMTDNRILFTNRTAA